MVTTLSAKRITPLSRRIDAINYKQYLEDIQQVIADGEREIVVDLQNVSFLDSSGLAVLIKGWQMAKESGAGFRVVGVNHEAVSMVFDITRVAQLFPVEFLDSSLSPSSAEV
jgi:anti-anti-sigma factor